MNGESVVLINDISLGHISLEVTRAYHFGGRLREVDPDRGEHDAHADCVPLSTVRGGKRGEDDVPYIATRTPYASRFRL